MTLKKMYRLLLNKNFLNFFLFLVSLLCIQWANLNIAQAQTNKLPLVINTWAFSEATKAGWDVLINDNGNVLDAVEKGCSVCEEFQCDQSVGYGSHPDENGDVTLDAMIYDGETQNVGAVARMFNIKNAISVARKVLDHTQHSLIVGKSATDFAIKFGFKLEKLETNLSYKQHDDWLNNNCQPNYWLNMIPDPKKQCGPYKPDETNKKEINYNDVDITNHDTIGMIAIDRNKKIAVGTSTNGASHKIPGRVSDSALPSCGGYADNDFGAAVLTGDGDVILRFAPAFNAVRYLEEGKSSVDAAKLALEKIYKKFPNNMAAIVVANKDGDFGAACFGIEEFPFSVINNELPNGKIIKVKCFDQY